MPTTRAAARKSNGNEERAKDGLVAKPGDKHKTTAPQRSPKKRKVEDSTEASNGRGEPREEKADEKKPTTQGHGNSQEEEEKKPAAGSGGSKGLNGTGETKSSAIGKESGRTSSIVVEKGIIYFFIRGRVNVPDPHSVTDIQRTYFVLRPLPDDAKLKDGVIPEGKNARLIALPKKKFPNSHRDRFMAFVEKSKASMAELKDTFFVGAEKETETRGTQEIPPVTAIGEGIYAVTLTGRTSHLAYVLTIPTEISEVQTSLGLQEKGSFVLSLKNPEGGGPSSAQLPAKPDFPHEIMEEFRGRKWLPVGRPEHLDYSNSQVLLIGEGKDSFAGAIPTNGEYQTAEDEILRLDEEEEARIEHLNGDDTIFDDLHVSKQEFPALKSTW
ncbi:hypothetical protein P152DRAFT_504494 [Eremomyces bilateralis CBS 781.70]|uniref:BTB domain transcription factor n=1 Tax=Eremomyces bilateralis CBS 781.70 TaxID=1392243 RepID=A0A6G1GG77_9PEZI|nr:uncharacterized protein P152DRAFT_504494 [Eremomyces bilateralis CBS 781.70]KAF1817105.1 hypothetical protein P152DRAFT_504494 [Eremomyces bilateralis CBS 781.70]